MNRKTEVVHIILSANAHRILIRESENRKVMPDFVVQELIMEKLLTTKQKVDDIMDKKWID